MSPSGSLGASGFFSACSAQQTVPSLKRAELGAGKATVGSSWNVFFWKTQEF